MKKSLFFYAAATALMLTACSSEDDILQTGPEKKVAPQEVGFDVYTSSVNDVTRAGFQGTLNTNRLQRNDGTGGAQWNVGFGIYAFYSDQTTSSAADDGYYELNTDYVPNFMWNEKILWNATSKGWEYSPLKYWPNETINDSQADEKAYMENKTDDVLDRLTFFAYAPYVENGVAGEPGITAITDNSGVISGATPTDPSVEYQASFKSDDGSSTFDAPSKGVDLLWGVAPAGGLNYTAVNGKQVAIAQGTPLINMTKPDVNTSMKFLFEHALARFGVTVAAAIDQLPQGGQLAADTKITIEQVKLTGYFGERGRLNLNNQNKAIDGKGIANWRVINGVGIATATDGGTRDPKLKTIVISGNNIKGNLRYKGPYGTPVEQPVVGVTTTKQDLIAPSTNHYGKIDASAAFAFDPAKVYYTSDDASHPTFKEAHATYTLTPGDRFYTKDASGKFTLVSGATLETPDYPEALMSNYYTVAETGAYTSVITAPTYYNATEASAHNSTHKLVAGLGGYKDPSNPGTYSTAEAEDYNKRHYLAENEETKPYFPAATYKTTTDVVTEEEEIFFKANIFAASSIAKNKNYTATQADLWNGYFKFTSSDMGGKKNGGETFTSAEANDYNSAHSFTSSSEKGYLTTSDVKIAGTYGAPSSLPSGAKLYERTGSSAPYSYEYVSTVEWTEANAEKTYCTLAGAQVPLTAIAFKYAAGTYYTPERNFYMVVPTNNIPQYNSTWATETNEKKLRTIDVEITYYITTEDAKLAKKRSQTKNVITKTVVLPSLANGKSYNLNLLLGLTSVKVEADVADWKEEFIQVDLPQNTAD